MQRYINNFIDTRGNAVPYATISVFNVSGAPATIYSDNGTTPLPNPFTTDERGSVAFYAADGRYNIKCEGSGVDPMIVTDVALSDTASMPCVTAWVKFNGLTGAILAGFNVASITGNSGAYTVNFTKPMKSANYAAVASVQQWNGVSDTVLTGVPTVNGIAVNTYSAGTLAANGEVSLIVLG
jgi:hypothetical protein